MSGIKKLLIIAALLPFSMLAKANHDKNGKSDPVLYGNISDASTKKPLSGVTISITSSRIHGEKEFITDASGNFKIPQLPAGEVTIVLEKKGYKAYRREGVILKDGVSKKLNFDIRSDDDEESADVFHPMLRMIEG